MSLLNPKIMIKQKIQSHQNIPGNERIKFTVTGNRVTREFIYCLYLVEGLHKYRPKLFKAPVIRGVTSVEWPKSWNDLKIQFGGLVHCLKSQVAVFIDDQFLGGENELRELVESKYVYNLRLDYYTEGVKQFTNYVNSCRRPCAYLQIDVNGEPIGTLIFMLYSDIVPLTCQNFLQLCEASKGGYGGTPIHRIVKDCWIQCGGYGLKSPTRLNCENFIVPHDRRGVLCMANDGRHTDCSTQFFVLLQPANWMEHKYVAFGQLIEGEETLNRIESIPTWYESPTSAICIYKAGIFNTNCHILPINKGANEYIDGHIEDLNTIGEIFYETILENVFVEANSKKVPIKALKPIKIVEEDIKNLRPAQRFMIKTEERTNLFSDEMEDDSDELNSGNTSYNNDFDVDIYEYEFEEAYDKQDSVATVSSVTKPKKSFYIPLTDVPYPGEVDSNFGLGKLLRGDYCLENDLEKKDCAKRKQINDARGKLSIPEDVLKTLYKSSENSDGVPEYYLNLNDENEIKKYIRENTDSMSFAGPVVNKMAIGLNKFEIVHDIKELNIQTDLLTDEELRLIRMAHKENPHLQSMSPPNIDSESQQSTSLGKVHEELADSDSGYDKLTSEVSGYSLISSDDSQEKHIRENSMKTYSSGFILNQKQSKAPDVFQILSETKQERSLKSIEFSKTRPSMTIIEYKLKNQKYQEESKKSLSMYSSTGI